MSRVQAKTREAALANPAGPNRTLILGSIMGLLLLGVAVLIFIALQGNRGPNTEQYESVQAEGRILGSTDAPLLIQEYADFRCPHCRDSSIELTPELIETYVATDQARFEIIPVGILGNESVFAAEAAYCAEEQGRFWAYHDILFGRQTTTSFTQDNLISLAAEVGIGEQPFRDCLLSARYRNQVRENNAAFQRAGATGTPAFLVGGELVEGAVPFTEMQPIIESKLVQ